MTSHASLTMEHVRRASVELASVIRPTPLMEAPSFCQDAQIYIKPENLQVTGSFKVRGASYMISQLTEKERAKGVIACSAGNRAQGVALAARKYGIRSIICLPEGAPISKVEATRSYGAEICLVPGVYDDAYNHALQLKEEQGMTFVHPFDDPLVIAGQGTIGLEILEDLEDTDIILCPVGGGGLACGVAYAVKQIRPQIQVYGIQSEGAPSMADSLRENRILRLDSVNTVADGIAVKQPGELTFELCRRYLDGVVTVSEDEICAAILHLLEKHKTIAEGAGAVSIAAAMFQKVPLKGKRVVCIVSGGNVDVNFLNRIINRGLEKSGRKCTLSILVVDKPGQLQLVSELIAGLGANVTAVLHDRNVTTRNISDLVLRVTIETRNLEHMENVRQTLKSHGFYLMDNTDII